MARSRQSPSRGNSETKPPSKSSLGISRLLDMRAGILFALFLLLTCFGLFELLMGSCSGGSCATLVWWYGWLTAASTGLGVLPFLFVKDMSEWWLGFCNALAAGMMVSASFALVYESSGSHSSSSTLAPLLSEEAQVVPVWVSQAGGFALGAVFIILSQHYLHQHEDLKFAGLSGINAEKTLLLLAVMFFHSVSEGVGIGVSFSSKHGGQFGQFIALTLAIHNIPEGLAICLVLIPRKVGLVESAVWSVFTSLPQPIMAVITYFFTKQMASLLPLGMGFAAGAMVWVAVRELFPEAAKVIGARQTASIAVVSGASFSILQSLVKHE